MALHSVAEPGELDVKAYAARVGRAKEYRNVVNEVYAARVASSVENVFNGSNLSEHYMKLVEIHAAPRWRGRRHKRIGKFAGLFGLPTPTRPRRHQRRRQFPRNGKIRS
jgi:hypothetical protein